MVTQDTRRRPSPRYDLGRVRELASSESVAYGSSRVQFDADNLGYGFEAVCQCLAELQADDFHHSERYQNTGPWLDVYLMRYVGPSGATDDLYIKLKLNKSCVTVVLCSFHPERG